MLRPSIPAVFEVSLGKICVETDRIFIFAVRIGLVYLISGLGGSILSSLFLRNSISVGASGALFGLLGAMLSELIINWTIYSNKASRSFNYISKLKPFSSLTFPIHVIDVLTLDSVRTIRMFFRETHALVQPHHSFVVAISF